MNPCLTGKSILCLKPVNKILKRDAWRSARKSGNIHLNSTHHTCSAVLVTLVHHLTQHKMHACFYFMSLPLYGTKQLHCRFSSSLLFSFACELRGTLNAVFAFLNFFLTDSGGILRRLHC